MVQNIRDPYDDDVYMWVKISYWWHQGIILYKSGCLSPAKSLHNLLWNASDNPAATQGKIILAIRSGLAYVMMTSSNGNISALLAFCAGNSPVTGEFPAQRQMMRSFDVFFDHRVE